MRASDRTELIVALELVGDTGPIELDPGQDHVRSLELDDSDPVDQDGTERLCAEPVQVLGSLTDTASGERATSLESAPVTPSGC